MQQWVYQTKVHDLDELNQHLIDVRHGLGQNIIDDALLMSGANVCDCEHVFVPKEDILSICFDSGAHI